ncbi:MAG: transposase [Candidatus Competibacteraceae bacterium]|nr:transposase [Candidatus Competibacteraceae bacterium]
MVAPGDQKKTKLRRDSSFNGAPFRCCKSAVDAIVRAYGARERVLDLLQKAGVNIVIPPESNRKEQREYDWNLYQARPPIENFFAGPKQYRAIATRCDKRAHNSPAPSTSPPRSSGSTDDTP